MYGMKEEFGMVDEKIVICSIQLLLEVFQKNGLFLWASFLVIVNILQITKTVFNPRN